MPGRRYRASEEKRRVLKGVENLTPKKSTEKQDRTIDRLFNEV